MGHPILQLVGRAFKNGGIVWAAAAVLALMLAAQPSEGQSGPPAYHVAAVCSSYAAAETLAESLVQSYPPRVQPPECQPLLCAAGPCLFGGMGKAKIVFGPLKDADGDAFAVYADSDGGVWLIVWLPAGWQPSSLRI